MTHNSQNPSSACGKHEILIMRRLDGEITPEEDAALEIHLASCPSCTRALHEYSKVISATARVEMRSPGDEQWEVYWSRVSNRLERSFAWLVVVLGAAVVLFYGVYRFATHVVRHPTMPVWAKVGLLALVAGFVLLFASVVREKACLWCSDRYRGVQR